MLEYIEAGIFNAELAGVRFARPVHEKVDITGIF